MIWYVRSVFSNPLFFSCSSAASIAFSSRVSNQSRNSVILFSPTCLMRGSEILKVDLFLSYHRIMLSLPNCMLFLNDANVVERPLLNAFHCSVSGKTSSSHLRSGNPSLHSSYFLFIVIPPPMAPPNRTYLIFNTPRMALELTETLFSKRVLDKLQHY